MAANWHEVGTLSDAFASELSTRQRAQLLSRRQLTTAVLVAIIGLIALGIGVAVLVVGDYMQASELAKNGETTSAVVLRVDPKAHNLVEYRYSVGERTYVGSGPADGPDGVASELAPGRSVRIVYSRRDPSVSCDCIPAQRTVAATTGLLFAALLMLAWVFGVIVWTLSSGGWQPRWRKDAGIRWLVAESVRRNAP